MTSPNSKKRKHRYTTRQIQKQKDLEKNKKLDDSSSEEEWESEESEEEEEEDEEMDMKEYRKFLNKIFPSKYIKEKIKNSPASYSQKKEIVNKKHKKKYIKSESEDSDSQSSDDDTDNDKLNKILGKKFNIIFTVGGDYKDESDSDYEEESDESESVSSSDSESEYDESEQEESEDEKESKKTKEDEKESKKTKEDEKESKKTKVSNKEAIDKITKAIETLNDSEKAHPIIQDAISNLNDIKQKSKKDIERKAKKIKLQNSDKFKNLLKEKNVLNDLKFFRDKMSIEEQQLIIKQMEEMKKYISVDKPYRLALLTADIPNSFKAAAYKKIETLKHMEPGLGEYYKIKNWVDSFMSIPFNKYRNLPISMSDGIEKCNEFIINAKETLDQAVFGLDDAKLQIMQMIGQWISNPKALGTAIAIKGPMGTGKTTLVKNGISKILGREFAFIALGGATDSSFLEGHSYTYEGSMYGKIVDILIQCKSMNPVIYFDELDKISETAKGEEIIGILTHLTDTTQNMKFHDKYFAEIDFDLSRCLFIFSYNDETKVNSILKDRMYRIQTKGYSQNEKSIIASSHLLPNIIEQINFNPNDIIISPEVINYIIEKYTDKEEGVRNLKRCLEIIYTKLNLFRFIQPDNSIFNKDLNINVKFPLEVTRSIVDKLIKIEQNVGNWQNMYL